MCVGTDLGSQAKRKQSSLAHRFPLLQCVPGPLYPRPCESMETSHPLEKKNTVCYGAEIDVL